MGTSAIFSPMRLSFAVTSGQNSKRRHCKSICEMNERPQQRGIILRIVFEVGVLNQYILAASVLKRSADGRAFAAILFVEDDRDVVGERHSLELLARAVGGTIVDDDDFFFYWRGVD